MHGSLSSTITITMSSGAGCRRHYRNRLTEVIRTVTTDRTSRQPHWGSILEINFMHVRHSYKIDKLCDICIINCIVIQQKHEVITKEDLSQCQLKKGTISSTYSTSMSRALAQSTLALSSLCIPARSYQPSFQIVRTFR